MEAVRDAVEKELEGPGKLLGYRAMNQKLRTEYNIKIPRHLVENVLGDLDPDGVAGRSLVKRKKGEKPFVSEGPLWLVSVDGHDKLCGYQNWTFPLGVYGFIDTFSRKIISFNVIFSNPDPWVIGRLYFDLLYNTMRMSRYLRMDKGTETGKMATIHTFLV